MSGLARPTEFRRESVPTFADAARTVHSFWAPKWRHRSTASDWIRSLEIHVFPVIGDRLVSDMLDLLVPLWSNRPYLARSLRQRIARIMQWAVAQGHSRVGQCQRAVDRFGGRVLCAPTPRQREPDDRIGVRWPHPPCELRAPGRTRRCGGRCAGARGPRDRVAFRCCGCGGGVMACWWFSSLFAARSTPMLMVRITDLTIGR